MIRSVLITVFVASYFCLTGPRVAQAAPLDLDTNAPFFFDDAETGVITDNYTLQVPSGDTDSSIGYSTAQAASGTRSVFYESNATNSRRKAEPKSLGSLASETGDYGLRIDIYIPSGVTQDQVFAIRPVYGGDPTPIQILDHATDTTKARLRAFPFNGGPQIYTVDRDTWITVQVDHLQATASGRVDVYVDDQLFVQGLEDTGTAILDGFELGSENSATGEVYYDNVLVAPAVIPEPGSVSVLLTGSILFVLGRRRSCFTAGSVAEVF